MAAGVLMPSYRGAAQTKLTIDFVTAVQTSANSLVCPAVEAGDVLVFVDSRTFSNTPAAAVPPGFMLISNTANTYTRTVTSYKVATGTEGGTALSTMVQVGGSVLMVFRPSRPGSVSVSPVNSGSAAANGAVPLQTIAVDSAEAPIVMIAACGSNFTDNPNLSLSGADGSFNGGQRAWASYRIQNEDLSAAAVSVATNNRTRTLNSYYLQVS